MLINSSVDGAFVASSGKNMGAFKGVGFPEEIGHYYLLEEYEGHTWTGHNRFPTNTPGWWGGAHPFTLLDWSIVHNGEISSYGINSRYLEAFGYKCTLGTDTEVAAYLFDLLLRRHKLPLELACKALASPLWTEIDRMPEEEQAVMRSLRAVYGPAMLNGPFAIVLGFNGGMVALNDRIKLRPLVAARQGTKLMVASEESRDARGARRSRRGLGAEGRRAGHRPRQGHGVADPRRPAPLGRRGQLCGHRCARFLRDCRGETNQCRRASFSLSSWSRSTTTSATSAAAACSSAAGACTRSTSARSRMTASAARATGA